ncbi:986_t:CDS:2 [Gigaspora margarita]|uniref:986_t:CDS:1 n=1 Tax=Gigaspora margarita TaxID=4874 RepID=A0ABN7V9E0_GIGMA|nr:986_t:CDS:2 [Gigaspora margarita]
MNTNTQAIQETDHEQPSETFHERKNHFAREAHARRIANETIEDAEQRQKESAEQTEMQRKKQKNAKHKVTKAAHCENYNTNDVTPHNIGRMNALCPECKALYWIGEKGTVQLLPVIFPPPLLQILLMDESVQAREFRKKIQIYNSVLAFTSMAHEKILLSNDNLDNIYKDELITNDHEQLLLTSDNLDNIHEDDSITDGTP